LSFSLAPVIYCCAGRLCEGLQKYEEAISYYEAAGQLGTYFCDDKYAIAACYQKLEKYKESYQTYLDIAEIHRQNGYDVEAQQAIGYAREIEAKVK
jgi:tetratricopeptide (TPR) repeat protein